MRTRVDEKHTRASRETTITSPDTQEAIHFQFDHCYASHDGKPPHASTDQEALFKDVGAFVLDKAFAGYKVTVMAYGQTGSGKSYTLMGDKYLCAGAKADADTRGLIPRCGEAVFARAQESAHSGVMCKVG
jgi:hypothetical protein